MNKLDDAHKIIDISANTPVWIIDENWDKHISKEVVDIAKKFNLKVTDILPYLIFDDWMRYSIHFFREFDMTWKNYSSWEIISATKEDVLLIIKKGKIEEFIDFDD